MLGRTRTESGDDDYFGALRDELAECFGEGEIPTYQHADFSQGRVEDFVGIMGGGGEVLALGVPGVCQPYIDGILYSILWAMVFAHLFTSKKYRHTRIPAS